MSSDDSREWVSVSDMMTGLMMVFLFVSVVFMQEIGAEKEAIEQIAVTYKNMREELHLALMQEFEGDLERWSAEILDDSTVRFNEPNIMFAKGSKDIKHRFKVILDDFFPRYIGVLGSEQYRENINEIRIEGHTSSVWEGTTHLEQRYLQNAKLSQDRSFSILQYAFKLPSIMSYQNWLTEVLRANGLAFARPIYIDGVEDRARSRRVEFKVTTKSEERIHDIVQTIRESQKG
jgi:outer membrane protein OmpA-like peptidoglycan-associated protein